MNEYIERLIDEYSKGLGYIDAPAEVFGHKAIRRMIVRAMEAQRKACAEAADPYSYWLNDSESEKMRRDILSAEVK